MGDDSVSLNGGNSVQYAHRGFHEAGSGVEYVAGGFQLASAGFQLASVGAEKAVDVLDVVRISPDSRTIFYDSIALRLNIRANFVGSVALDF
ncbi:hypothetical protein AAVH_14576 [Aphelenchoides avenae]|nr:hypothetical protein AAVH_14576 [Aphelenchus avenae]